MCSLQSLLKKLIISGEDGSSKFWKFRKRFFALIQAGDSRESFKKIFVARHLTVARAASNFRWTDAKVLAPSRLVLGGGLLCLSEVHASPAPSLQKNFPTDENLFFRSVTGLAIVGMARGHCIESAEGALGRTSLPHCNVGCAVTLSEIPASHIR